MSYWVPRGGLPGQAELTTGQSGRAVFTEAYAILPRGTKSTDPVFAGWFSLNGNGEMTGTTWIEESGFLDGPVLITNTHSVGVVRDAVIAWQKSVMLPQTGEIDLESWKRLGIAEPEF